MILIRMILLGLATIFPFLPMSVAKTPSKAYPSVPGEYVVKLKFHEGSKAFGVFESIARRLETQLGMKSPVLVRRMSTTDQFGVVKIKGESLNSKSVITALNSDERVAYAEPNYLFHALSTPNDEKFNQLWGMQNTGQTDTAGQAGKAGSDIGVVPVWNEGITGNKNVKVAVIDTGVDYLHPDLRGNILVNQGEIAGDGIDNDRNGFIDDVYGWNFSENQPNGMDDHNHGTHCAGTIGGMGNNTVGVTGVNWNVSILPVKFLNAQGSGSLDAAIQSIQYATQARVDIMSNSWGGGPYTQALYDVIQEARDQGILFVAAAGNDSNDNDANASYPATYALDNVLSVAATDNRDQIAVFSNYGRTKVHVAAPGVKILSTTRNNTYSVFSGTSMATPHVSGIAALMKSANPSLTYAEIKDLLIRTSDKVRGLSKKVVARGRVNAWNAIHGIVPVDTAPAENLWKDYSYTVESPHPYADNQTYTYDIQVPGAKYIRVIFDKIDTESNYDQISISDSNGDEIEKLSGSYTDYVGDYIVGSKATLRLKSDQNVNKYGFKVKRLQVIQ